MICELDSGVKLNYEWVNKDQNGPVILFLHEGLGSIGQWKDYPHQLCRRTGLPGLIYDRQGYGESSPLTEDHDENYIQKYALEELPQFLKIIAPNRYLILYGHSDGGSMAYIYASEYPKNVKGIISEAAHVFVEDVTLEGITAAIKAFEEKGLDSKLGQYHGNKTVNTFYNWANAWHKKRRNNWNIEHYLPGVLCPSLVIQGEDDEYGTLKQLEAIYEQTTGASQKLIIPECKHIPHKQQTEIVLNAAEKFIRSLL